MTEFEIFLTERHARQYQGHKDNMIKDYEHWLSEFDIDTWIKLGEWFGNKKFDEALFKLRNKLGRFSY